MRWVRYLVDDGDDLSFSLSALLSFSSSSFFLLLLLFLLLLHLLRLLLLQTNGKEKRKKKIIIIPKRRRFGISGNSGGFQFELRSAIVLYTFINFLKQSLNIRVVTVILYLWRVTVTPLYLIRDVKGCLSGRPPDVCDCPVKLKKKT